jgi:predicted PurR-regulated permease PerM
MASDWQRALIALSAVVVGSAVIAVLSLARVVLIPLALAIFLAFVLSPIVARLQRRGLGRTPAVIATVGLLLLGAVGIGAVIAQQVIQLAETLPDRQEAIKAKVIAAKQWVGGNGESRFGRLVDDVGGVIAPAPPEKPTEVVVKGESQLTGQLDRYLTPAAELLGQAAFTFILTVYMLLNREDLRNRMIRLTGHGKVTTTTKAVDDASQRISRYLLRQLMVNSAFGMIIAVGLFLLGVKYSILWGFIATLMRYVPYIGTWVGLLPPTLYSFATAPDWGGGFGQPAAVIVLFLGLEAFCNNVVEPKLYGRSMGLSEVAQLVSAAFWAFLWGPIGLILSGPLTVCLLVLGRHVSRYEFFVVLLGDEPALDPQVAYYQRLAARDQDEAAEVAVANAKEFGPDATFDRVVLPALCLARRDQEEGDLDPADLRYVNAATREIAEELAELREAPNGTAHERVRVLLCPARNETDHVAAELLALTLDPNRWEVKVAGDETLASELVELVREFRPAVVVITMIPPGGLSHARYLITRLRQRFPEVKVLVGHWGCDESTDRDARPEALRNTDGIDRTIGGTRKRLSELHPLLATAAAGPADERPNKAALVGTPGA